MFILTPYWKKVPSRVPCLQQFQFLMFKTNSRGTRARISWLGKGGRNHLEKTRSESGAHVTREHGNRSASPYETVGKVNCDVLSTVQAGVFGALRATPCTSV
ncbi:hypothetical protein CEXT_6451 [Caerostris extrusa]|uniref:Uncharacterized protein n=1 Tax=Caerostris extrusa TaxID=172846 RepID=A0AAV4U4V2_CAEEX|nr:hypothetical protein CEXT_6451 [Caerostris extrusa]